MLMEHTSGIPEYYELGDFTKQLRENPDRTWTPEACIGYVLGIEPHFPAGSGWSYADTNYLLLGMVLEEILHTKAYDEIQQHFIQPHKLSSTEPSVKRTYDNFVHGITTPNNPFGLKEQMVVDDSLVINPQMEWAGGGFISNTADLARWAKIYYEGKGISEELLQEQRKGVAAHGERPSLWVRYADQAFSPWHELWAWRMVSGVSHRDGLFSRKGSCGVRPDCN